MESKKPDIARLKKRIKELEAENEILYEDQQIHKYCILGLANRVSNLEQIMVAIGFTHYRQSEEEVLLN